MEDVKQPNEAEVKKAKLIELSITKLAACDPEYTETLFLISKFAEKNPNKYKMVRGMLKSEVAAILKKEKGA